MVGPPSKPEDDHKTEANSQPSPTDRGALRPPQFTLATMLWIVAGVCALLAGMTTAGPIGGFALLLFVLALIAHVAGNAIGSRLREIGDDPLPEGEQKQRRPRSQVLRDEYAPASKLSRRTNISLTMIIFTITGALLLGTAGGGLLIWLTWGELNIPTAVVAVLSSTVLGGFLGFITSSFTQVAGGAWWEANRYVRKK